LLGVWRFHATSRRDAERQPDAFVRTEFEFELYADADAGDECEFEFHADADPVAGAEHELEFSAHAKRLAHTAGIDADTDGDSNSASDSDSDGIADRACDSLADANAAAEFLPDSRADAVVQQLDDVRLRQRPRRVQSELEQYLADVVVATAFSMGDATRRLQHADATDSGHEPGLARRGIDRRWGHRKSVWIRCPDR
jgi:hypothetical protein